MCVCVFKRAVCGRLPIFAFWWCLTSTILTGPLRLFTELWPLFGSGYSWVIVVQTLCHPLTDDVHQALKRLLHVNVVFGTGFKVLKTCQKG